NSGFGFGDTFIEKGKPPTEVVGFAYDANGQKTATQVQVGNTQADFRTGLVSEVNLKSINFSMTWDWQQGSTVNNLTRLLYDLNGLAPDNGSPDYNRRLKSIFDGVAGPYIESGTFVKLREISIGTGLPKRWVTGLGIGLSDARLSLAARNLFIFTPYTGLDPEVSNFSSLAVRSNIDVTPYPPSRSFFINLALGF